MTTNQHTVGKTAGLLKTLPDGADLREFLQLLPTDNEMATLADNVTDADLETLVERSLYGKTRAKSFQEYYRGLLGIMRSKPA